MVRYKWGQRNELKKILALEYKKSQQATQKMWETKCNFCAKCVLSLYGLIENWLNKHQCPWAEQF